MLLPVLPVIVDRRNSAFGWPSTLMTMPSPWLVISTSLGRSAWHADNVIVIKGRYVISERGARSLITSASSPHTISFLCPYGTTAGIGFETGEKTLYPTDSSKKGIEQAGNAVRVAAPACRCNRCSDRCATGSGSFRILACAPWLVRGAHRRPFPTTAVMLIHAS